MKSDKILKLLKNRYIKSHTLGDSTIEVLDIKICKDGELAILIKTETYTPTRTLISIIDSLRRHIRNYFGFENVLFYEEQLSSEHKEFLLKEATIKPLDFDSVLTKISETKILSIDHLNSFFNGSVFFITDEQFKIINPEAKLPNFLNYTNGVGFGSVQDGVIYVICRPAILIHELNGHWNKRVISQIRLFLRHESVHIQQIQRSGGRLKDVDDASNPEMLEKYYSNKQELMAFAISIVDQIKDSNPAITNTALLDTIKKSSTWSSILQMYGTMFRNKPKVLQRLRKYMYQYVRSLHDE